MKTNIVIITSKYLHPYIQNAFEKFRNDCNIIFADYVTFDHVADIYKRYEEIADGFMISGSATVSVIEHQIGEFKKPIIAFQADSLSFYQTLATLFLGQRDLSPERCIFDFILPLSQDMENASDSTVSYFIQHLDQKQLDETMYAWIKRNTTGDFSQIVSTIANKIITLWENKKIDMVLCSYSSIVPLLKEKKIPYHFFYPVKEQLEEQIKELLIQIQFEKYIENLPAAIAISCQHETIEQTQTGNIREVLQQIKKDFLMDAIIQSEADIHYIYTTHRAILILTKNFEIGYFPSMLKDNYQIPAFVGYGVGNTISEAKKHAEYALRESKNSNGCFVMTESRQLIGPLDASQMPDIQQDFSETLFKTAEACKLSTLTIQKLVSIIKITGSCEFTTKELANYLEVTDRNANRILRNLENGGAATIIHTRSTTSKGRPVKVYRLNLS